MNNKKRQFTDEELIRRVTDIEEIRNLTARRAYYYINGMHKRELDELWVQEPEHQHTASFGRNWGYKVGMDSIRRYYVNEYESNIAGKCGIMEWQPISTPQFELAGDGKTARVLWYSSGQRTEPDTSGQPLANWSFEKMGIDYIKEAGGWKIWHLAIATELYYQVGIDYASIPPEIGLGDTPFEAEFGVPDISMLTHDVRLNWCDNYPPQPEPYDTFDVKHSYAPEGHPNYQKPDYVFNHRFGGKCHWIELELTDLQKENGDPSGYWTFENGR